VKVDRFYRWKRSMKHRVEIPFASLGGQATTAPVSRRHNKSYAKNMFQSLQVPREPEEITGQATSCRTPRHASS